MMIVKVIFAEMNHAYDFKVDETQKVKQVVTEMAEMIAEKEHLNLSKDSGMFLFVSAEQTERFSAGKYAG